MSHKMLRPFSVKVSVLGYSYITIITRNCFHKYDKSIKIN